MRFFNAKLWLPALLALRVNAVNVQANSPNCTAKTQFFTQLVEVDHNSTANGTFPQQYKMLKPHFKPGGPTSYYQQAETGILSCFV